jgi:hypothetical protein
VQASRGALWPVVLAIAGTLGDQRGGAVGGVHLRHGRSDDGATRGRLTALAAPRWQAPGHPGVRLDPHCPQDVMEGGPVLPTIAAGPGHAWGVGDAVAVIAAIDREAGALERRHAWAQAQTLGSRGRQETRAGGDAIRLARLERPPARLIMPRLGCNHAGRQAARGRVIREQPRPQGAWWVHHAEAVADPRGAGMAGRDEAPRRGVLGRLVTDVSAAPGVNQAGAAAQMIPDVAAGDVWAVPRALRCG